MLPSGNSLPHETLTVFFKHWRYGNTVKQNYDFAASAPWGVYTWLHREHKEDTEKKEKD
jgi:hypothetical protein